MRGENHDQEIIELSDNQSDIVVENSNENYLFNDLKIQQSDRYDS